MCVKKINGPGVTSAELPGNAPSLGERPLVAELEAWALLRRRRAR